jgi:hypothetical protein
MMGAYIVNLPTYVAGNKRRALAARAATHLAAGHAAESLLEKTLQVVPYDEGDLYDSGRVVTHGPGVFGVQFGGPEAPHAIYVHEDLTATHAPPTKAKFLEGTYLDNKVEIAGTIMAAARGAMHV